jgi:hypothetical protein
MPPLQILAISGALLALAGQITIAIAAYEEGLLWFWSCLLIPFAAPFFVLTHGHRTRVGFSLYAVGVLALTGALLQTARTQEIARLDAKPTLLLSEPCHEEEKLPAGYAKWCCTMRGWRFVSGTGCASDPPTPVSECRPESHGVPARISCR